jgi:hypothetical protein
VATIAMLGGVVAAPAAAKVERTPKILTRTGAATTTSAAYVSAIATCPKGTTLIGGGFDAPYAQGSGGFDLHIVNESRRLSANQWIVSAFRVDNAPAGNPLDLTSYARCRKREEAKGTAAAAKTGGLKASEQSTTISVATTPPTRIATATVTCPGKTKAIAGGFLVLPPPTATAPAYALESFPSAARDWTVTGLNGGTSPARTFTAYAYCARTKVVSRSGSAVLPGPSGSTASALTEACPRKLRLGAGGYQLQAPNAPPTFQDFPLASVPSGSSWSFTGFKFGVATTTTSHATCL